jgi:hypothetical protein
LVIGLIEVGALDRQIDGLYQLAPSAFTAARTALAKTLTGDAAKRIRALKKPAAVPWSVNQLFWRAKPAYEQLMRRGRALRDTQIAALKGRAADVRAATDAHRAAIREAVHEAAKIASQSGVHADAEHVGRMLEAISLAAVPPEDQGRFTRVIEPSGFEALTGVTPAARPHPAKANTAAAEEREKREQRQRETAIKAATRALDRARERASAARAALQRAEAEVAEAEHAVSAARQSPPKSARF